MLRRYRGLCKVNLRLHGSYASGVVQKLQKANSTRASSAMQTHPASR
jgi:hypothetical protein